MALGAKCKGPRRGIVRVGAPVRLSRDAVFKGPGSLGLGSGDRWGGVIPERLVGQSTGAGFWEQICHG